MISGRMLEIIRFLNKERVSSYKEIADALSMKERTVRYDVDSINEELSLKRMEQIEKYPKGMLFLPDGMDLDTIMEEGEFVFSPAERTSIICFMILFGTERLNIRQLSEDLQVSRRSIQNDIETIQNDIGNYHLILEYDKKFFLKGESEESYHLRCQELEKYVSLIMNGEYLSAYERYIEQMFQEVFLPVEIRRVTGWVNETAEKLGWVFSDGSYTWFVSNVLTFTWYVKYGYDLPQKDWKREGQLDEQIGEYECIIGRMLSDKERGILTGFSQYTSRYAHLDVNLDLLKTEDIVMQLIKGMEQELHLDFAKDGILMKGLLNHIPPMIERVRDCLQLNEDVSGFIPEEFRYVYQALKEILMKDEVLSQLTENEAIYLAIYFIGSLKRLQQNQYMNALLVCGFGYGTTAVVKDTLLNEYQIYVKDCIPTYKLKQYQNWDNIDIVISVVKTDLPVEKPFAQVNVILKKEDYVKLDLLGLRRKNVLTNYFAIERRLDFLKTEDRSKVMDVVKEELGYKEVRMPSKYYTVSDLLGADHIRCVDKVSSWQESVQVCTGILEGHGCITSNYHDSIIQGIEVQGFYSVTDGSFALLHGSETAGVEVSCMSLLISREPVSFGEKKVNIIFCLASRDKKEHVPAVIKLVRMVSMVGLIDKLKECTDSVQAMMVIEECEKEVEGCYQS